VPLTEKGTVLNTEYKYGRETTCVHPKHSDLNRVVVFPPCRLSALRKDKTRQTEFLLISIVSTHADSDVIDPCRTKLGVIDPLLGKDRDTNNYISDIAKKRLNR
jgi:hypothetical protein